MDTLLVSRRGTITPGLPGIVSAYRSGPVETRVRDRPEDNTYHIPPGLLEAASAALAGAAEPVLIVDGLVHPGQAVDLQERLPDGQLYDRRSLVWAHLAADNPVAETQLEYRRAAIAHRAAVAAGRDGGPASPSGTRGETAALEARLDTLRETRDQQRAATRAQAAGSYTDVDAHVVLVGRPGAPTGDLWATVTGAAEPEAVGRPAQPATDTTTVGPHTVAVTDTPGIPGTGGVPDWLQTVLPGLEVALDRAALVLGVGAGAASLIEALEPRVSALCRHLGTATTAALRDTVNAVLDRRRYRLRLPYTDPAHALLAELHDTGVVHDVTYDDTIVADLTVAATAADSLTRRVETIEGAHLTPTEQ